MASSHRMVRSLREKLVEEVQSYPMLYNTNHENHRDNDMRDRAWLEISAKLGVNSETLKREWKILRDSFRQALRKRRENLKLKKKGGPMKKWYFESKMAFLTPFMTQRPVYQMTEGSTDMLAKLDAADSLEQDEGSSGTAARGAGRLVFDGDEPLWTNDDVVQETESGGDLELFFASVCQSCRRLPRPLQAKVKRQVLDALLRAEDELHTDSKTHVAEF